MKVEINKIVLDAMRWSLSTLSSYTRSMEATEHFTSTDSVGLVIQSAHSECLSQIAVIQEFVKRCDDTKK